MIQSFRRTSGRLFIINNVNTINALGLQYRMITQDFILHVHFGRGRGRGLTYVNWRKATGGLQEDL